MADLKIVDSSAIVKILEAPLRLNPPAPLRAFDEHDDVKYMMAVAPSAMREYARAENLDPMTFEPAELDLSAEPETFGRDKWGNDMGPWGRTYGHDAADLGNYIDFLRSN